ncbi:MAG: type II secretion system F family protein [Nitrospinae bacterium]|nr:type II secretion system F family protein [Nitrospinota bacterium]
MAAEVDGRVEKLLFHEGQYVRKGTPLVKLRIAPLIIQRDLARAEKKLVEARLEELNTGTRSEIIEAARSAVAQSKAKVRLAESELKRIEKLFEGGVLSLDEFDKADAAAQAARSQTSFELAAEAIDTMLSKIADFYDAEVDVAVEALTSLLEPIMMVGLGGTVGTLLVAMYLPIFKIAEAVK